MRREMRKPLALLAILIALVFLCVAIADGIQCDHGRVHVTLGSFDVADGTLTYKLYRPESATDAQLAPGVLLLHGYQNDRETSAAYAVELARRGVVVLSLDEYGHGGTDIGMVKRGYINRRVKANYGDESEADGTLVSIGGPSRYKVMMNFSTLDFFDPRYTTDDAGNAVVDSSMGGVAAYGVLAGLSYVDETRLAVLGHSMGTWASWTVGARYTGAVNASGADISPKAIVLSCGELFRDTVYDTDAYRFNNVLLLQAKYDEFNCFRDYENTVSDELIKSSLRTAFLGCTAEQAAWDTTYGSFSDGSARRVELIRTNHRLTSHDSHAVAAALDWFKNAIGIASGPDAYDQVFMQKELLVLLAMLLALAAAVQLMEVLLCTPYFGAVRRSLPDRPQRVKSGRGWWRGALITMLISGLSYPFMTQLGHGLLPLPENVFRMTVGNGFVSWYLFLILIMLLTTVLSWRKAKKRGDPMDYADLGLATEGDAARIDWRLCGRSGLLALCMLGLVYALVTLCEACFKLDFRFIWPFLKHFTGERFLQFLVYLPVFALFFLLNNSKIFAQMRVRETAQPGFPGFIRCWWKYALCMAGGILLIILIEYIPFFAELGPGADLLFTPTFGGPFMSLMILFLPQVLVFSVLCTYIYRRTGSVYTGAFTVSMLACWIVTGGSAIL